MNHHKRKRCICKRCNKDKLHFGLGMCSACIRRTKRENKPSFYLGTCYSEMTRRTKHLDVLRPKYLGKKICTKLEFFNRFLNDSDFLTQFEIWKESGYQRCSSPSIDRIDNEGDYNIENLRFISHSLNTGKDSLGTSEFKMKKVIDSDGIIYKSISYCAKVNKVSSGNLRKYIEIGKELNGKKYKFCTKP